ncbi:hypothetical protein BU16DRAFT_544377 [Lophium mytilinum]|uniref:RING-type domain-containing protein n=1 Tax=Lophium mytilinum TaxID=390894 RepID=A0A6A6QD76_9PEZI|nr:hypothetical protein BU16DRAFT_544377 [Lophium mytilinum]
MSFPQELLNHPFFATLQASLTPATLTPSDDPDCQICDRPFGELPDVDDYYHRPNLRLLASLPFSIQAPAAAIPTDPVRTPCNHTFCRFCISRWLSEKPGCPNCRTPIPTPGLSHLRITAQAETDADMMMRTFNLSLEQYAHIRRIANLTDREIMTMRLEEMLPDSPCTILDTQTALAELEQVMILVARRSGHPRVRFDGGRDPVHRRSLYPTPVPMAAPISQIAPADAWLARTREADMLYRILATWMRRYGGLSRDVEGSGEAEFGAPITVVAETLFRIVENLMGRRITVDPRVWWKYVRQVLQYWFAWHCCLHEIRDLLGDTEDMDLDFLFSLDG